jgi:hypothetical protein
MTNGWIHNHEDDEPDTAPIEAQGFEILDRNRDTESGELLSFLVMEDGEPIPKKATAENILLYEHGLKEFLSGQHAVIVSNNSPEVVLAPTGNDKAYLLRVNGNTVETTPAEAADLLESLKDVVEADNSVERDSGVEKMVSVYDNIISTQVRRWLVRAMLRTFDAGEQQRVEEIDRGWLVDGFYLVDWNASLYTIEDDPDEDDYTVGGGGATAVDRSYEFLELTPEESPEAHEVRIDGDEYRLSEREMLFLSKVRLMLDRRYYHNDMPFWKYNDKLAGLDG